MKKSATPSQRGRRSSLLPRVRPGGYWTVSVPYIPIERWPGIEQENSYMPGGAWIVTDPAVPEYSTPE
jgi:hypothetical protein